MEEQNDIFDHLKPRKTPVPDASYFESLANAVIQSQKDNLVEAPKETKIIPLYKRPLFWMGTVAAIFIAGILIVNFSKSGEDDKDPLLALNELSSDEVYKYVNDNIDDFDTDLITEALNEDMLHSLSLTEPDSSAASIKVNTSTQPISFDDLDYDDILDYFNEEGIDAEDLEDEDSFI